MDDVSMNVSMNDNSQESQKTQPTSQSDSVRPEDDVGAECWGLLLPCTPGINRVRFLKTTPTITVGRDPQSTVVLAWTAISRRHAVITWNGKEDGESIVTVEDCSSNSTYLKGELIGKGNTRVLSDGCEISFGPARLPGKQKPEYRYTYRDLVSETRAIFRKYDLSVELGHGSFARVYKALQKGTSRWVAVKVINQTMRFNLTPAREAGAIREITVMRTLRHPNICAFLDYFENPDKSIDIVLEYMDGGDLGTYMTHTNNGQGIGEWMSCHFTYQICQAVMYIHSCKITHRDLKPENILLTLDQPPIVKIADFGLAKLVDEVTALRTICGTRSYMAPEVITRMSTDDPYTNLVDSWSIGAIVFSMFTMETPFPKVATLEVKALVSNQLLDWVHLDNKEGISENGKDFVRQLLVFDPDQRMTLISAQEHPWLVHHKPTYEFQSPAAPEGQTITRTASLNSGFSSSAEPPAHPLLSRAVTVDPYADDPYADDCQFPQPPVRTLRTPPPAPLDPIAELSPGLPGLRRVPKQSTPPPESATASRPMLRTANNEQRPNPLDPPTMAYVQDSTDEMLYGPTPTPDLRAGPVAPEGGAQKRTFAEMHIDGSSPLTSIASSPPPPPKKSNKRKTVAKKTTTVADTKPDAPARAGRKAKVQKQEDPGVENPPALRRSNRPARPARH